jgi:dipeptidyl aminopeptidase/acylaminoacyl peptidase
MSTNHQKINARYFTFLIAVFALLASLQIVAAFAQSATSRRPITHEDVWLMKRVGAPIPSPDGKWVVFSVIEPAYDEKDQASDLWITPADGSARPRRLTFTKGAESGAAWSPDSRKMAFSARREGDEVNQIYVINVAEGGEAVRVTSLSTGARAPQWRPDGKALLFASTVFPGALDDEANKKIAAERRARKYRARVYESFPIRNWDRWLEDTQTHIFVQSFEASQSGGAKAKDLLAGTKLANERGFAGRTASGSDELDAVWAPDGQSIVFVATTNRQTAAYAETDTHLYQVSAAGGEPRQLTSGKDSFTRPAFSPDGKALYCLLSPDTDKVYNSDRIAVFAWPNVGERKIVTAGFDRSVSSFALSPDSKTVYLLAEDAGHEKLYSVPAQGGEVKPAMEMNLGVYTNLAVPARAPSTMLIANWESAINPAEVVRLDLNAKRHTALSDFNAGRAAAIDWQPLRHFWFASQRGKQIHNMLALPPAFDENKKYPLFVLMHGGPHSMWRDQFFVRWNYHLLAQPGYVVLLTNYTGSTGFSEKFAQEIQGDPLKGPGDEINEAADEAIRRFKFIDGSRQAAGGASYGGHLANWLQATTTRYKCLISHAGLVNLESQWGTSDIIYSREVNNGGPVWEQGPVWREQNPIRYAKNFRTPILLTIGEQDFRVPLNNTIENWSVLQRLRVPSRLIVFPEENHWVLKGENSRFFYQEVHAWLKKYLNGEGQS